MGCRAAVGRFRDWLFRHGSLAMLRGCPVGNQAPLPTDLMRLTRTPRPAWRRIPLDEVAALIFSMRSTFGRAAVRRRPGQGVAACPG